MKRIFLMLTIVVLFIQPAHGAQVDEIVAKSNHAAYYKDRDGSARVSMTITDSLERTRTRQFTILRKDDPGPDQNDAYCGDQKYYVYFNLPADVNKMVFMVWKHLHKDDDRWLYLPALDLVKRISAKEKRTSFVGSDFLYEDVSGRHINDDVHILEKEDGTFFVLKNTPKNPDTVEFSYYRTWIHKQTYLVIKVEYFNKQGEKYREYEARKVETIQGNPTVIQSIMKDLRAGSSTLLEYTLVRYNIDVPDDIFTERYLRRAPMQFLR